MDGGALPVALAGAGYWGSRLARNLHASPEWQLVAVHDTERSRAEATARLPGARVVDTFEALLEDPGITAVVVATPSATHAQFVRRALDAGKDVLVAKPLAGTTAEAEALGALAEARRVVLACDQTYRFSPVVTWLRDLCSRADAGAIAEIRSWRANADHGQPDLPVIWDLAYHDLVILDAVLPGGLQVTSVCAREEDRLGRGRPHAASVELELLGGARAVIDVDWNWGEKVRSMSFAGADLVVSWDDLADDRDRLTVCTTSQPPVHPAVAGPEPLELVTADFARAVRTRTPPAAGAAEELRVLRALAAASDSVRLGRPVEVGRVEVAEVAR